MKKERCMSELINHINVLCKLWTGSLSGKKRVMVLPLLPSAGEGLSTTDGRGHSM